MAKAKSKNRSKKPMTKKMKRNMRFTIAALFMVTAVVIALIPVQNGGVSAIAAANIPEESETRHDLTTDAPTGHGVIGTNVELDATKKIEAPKANLLNAYPFDQAINVLTTDNTTITYNLIDTSGFIPPSVVPIYELYQNGTGSTATYDLNSFLAANRPEYTPKDSSGKQGYVSLGTRVVIAASPPPALRDLYYDNATTVVPDAKGIPTEPDTFSGDGVCISYKEEAIDGNNDILKLTKLTRVVVKIETYDNQDPPELISTEYKVDDSQTVQETFYACRTGSGHTDPVFIQNIRNNAFENAQNVVHIQLPENLTNIGKNAFKGCTSLETADIDIKCETIGDSAFEGCRSMTNLNLSSASSLTKIGDRAFYGCEKIDNISLGSSKGLKSIGNCAFYNCRSASGLTLAGADMVIGSGAFMNCTNLNTINLDEAGGSTTLGCNVFTNCTSLNAQDDAADIPLELKTVTKIYPKDATDANKTHPANSNCGIFTNCKNLHIVYFNDYNSELPLGTFAGVVTNVPSDQRTLECIRFDQDNGKPAYGEFLKGTGAGASDTKKDEDLPKKFYIWGNKDSASYNYVHDVKVGEGITYRYNIPPADDSNYEIDWDGYRYIMSVDGNDATVKKVIALSNASTTLEFPVSVGGYNIKAITGDTDGGACQGLSKPEIVRIPDSVATIGRRAFYDMPNLEQVMLVRDNDVPMAPTITFGEDCFFKCNKMKRLQLRSYDYGDATGGYVDPNIEFEEGAFRTGSKELTICGRIAPDYKPFLYATDKEKGHINTSDPLGYIVYETCEPELIRCQYDPRLNDGAGGVSLLKYPSYDQYDNKSADTRVKIGEDAGKNAIYDSLENIYKRCVTYMNDPAGGHQKPSDLEMMIAKNFEDIFVPAGITNIDNANDGKMFQNLNGTKTVTLGSVPVIPDLAFASINTDDPAKLLSESNDDDGKKRSTLQAVRFSGDVVKMGETPFLSSTNVSNVEFIGEGETATKEDPKYMFKDMYIYADSGDGDLSLEECLPIRGKIGAPDLGDINTAVKTFKPSAFKNCDEITSVDLYNCKNLTNIPEQCFFDCDSLGAVILPESVQNVAPEAFSVELGNRGSLENRIEVTHYNKFVTISDEAFKYDRSPIIKGYDPSSAKNYADKHDYVFKSIEEKNPVTLVFIYYDENNNLVTKEEQIKVHEGERARDKMPNVPVLGRKGWKFTGEWDVPIDTLIPDDATRMEYKALYEEIPAEEITASFYDTVTGEYILVNDLKDVPVDKNGYPTTIPKPLTHAGYVFKTWDPSPTQPITKSTVFQAIYEQGTAPDPSTSSSSGGGGGGGGSSTSGGGGGGSSSTSGGGGSASSSSTSASSSSARSSSSNSGSSYNYNPVVVSGAPAPYSGGMYGSVQTPPSTNGTVSAPSTNVQTGNTNVVSTAPGIDSSKFSATVNGSSDNYIIKITETVEADELAKQALSNEFGSLDNIRYVPFDISLYDSSGTQKISPVPAGVTVSVTMPIPDDLTIYGGNNKVGSTIGGSLEKIQPRFTVIDGVPCMNFTATHLSPYVVYVDTANLTAGGVQDATPKTADPIHPKWFLVIGFAAISIFLFLKRDKQSMPVNAA